MLKIKTKDDTKPEYADFMSFLIKQITFLSNINPLAPTLILL